MKTDWGSVLVDLVIIAVAAWTRLWWLLILMAFTGSYRMKE